MDVNAIGLPVNRPALQSSTRVSEEPTVPGTKNYVPTEEAEKVNTQKAALPDGVGARVDKSA